VLTAATQPTYTLSGITETLDMSFDGQNRLLVGNANSVMIFATGSNTLVATVPNVNPLEGLAVDALGNVATAGWQSDSFSLQANGRMTSLGILNSAVGVAISP
jgi:hypothetical protein